MAAGITYATVFSFGVISRLLEDPTRATAGGRRVQGRGIRRGTAAAQRSGGEDPPLAAGIGTSRQDGIEAGDRILAAREEHQDVVIAREVGD
jgi:hypothetical protein